ncbi:MAG: tetratricopeptide repeat protein [Candidatus Zixiibacteriota bacterium]
MCKECGEENLFGKATHCRKCGAELVIASETEVLNSKDVNSRSFDEGADEAVISNGEDVRDSTSREANRSEIESEDEDTGDRASVKMNMVDPFDPGSDSSESEKDDDNSCTGTVEIDLPEEPEETEHKLKTDDEQQSIAETPSQRMSDENALATEDRNKLIADLQTKIPSMVKDNQKRTPVSIDEKLRPIISNIPDDNDPTLEDFSRDLAPQSQTDEPDSGGAMLALPSIADSATSGDSLLGNRTAFFAKNRVQFPTDVRFKGSDRLAFADEVFVLKPRGRDNKSFLLYGVLGLVIILVLVSQFIRNGKDYYPPLAGVIVDGETGKVLPDVRVTIDELDKSVVSNRSGLFVFELLPSGSYTITADTPLYSSASISFYHGDGGSPVVALHADDGMSGEPGGQSRSETSASTDATSSSEPDYGAIKIETDHPDAEIYLDNKKYGTGSRKINRVLEGKHKLAVAMKGYERFEQTVSVSKNKTTTVTANLAKIQTVKRELTAEEYVQSADSALTAGDFQTAIEMYTQALAKKESAETFYKRAQLYHKAGRPGDARADFMRAGNLFASSGQATSAIGAFNAVLDLFPNDMKALRARGYSNINRGEYELALADFKTASNLDENDYENQIGLGNAYSVLGKHKDAIKAYKNAEGLTESKAEAYALIAMTSLVRGKEKDARKYYEKFLETASPEDEMKYARDPDWQRLKQIASND